MLIFAVPMIFGNVLQQCYNLADAWVVGKYIGADALGAVGSAYTLMTFLTSLIIGMCMGAGSLFSICFGQKAFEKMREYLASSFVLVLAITAVLTALSYTLLDTILHLMQTPPQVYDMMREYMLIILAGLPFIFLYNYFAFLLRALGNSVTALLFLGISTVLNIVLDFVFVASLRRGCAGAAEATVIAQMTAGIGIAVYGFLFEPMLRPDKTKPLRIRRKALAAVLVHAVATGAQQSVMNFGILMVQGLVNSFGPSVMAAFAAGVKIDTLAYMPAQEFGNAYSIFISQNYGAGNTDRIRKGSRSAVILVICFCAVISAAVWMLAKPLMSIFILPEETQVLAVGIQYLRIEGACYIGIGILFLLYGYFRAVGHPTVSLTLTVVSLGLRVLLSYCFAPGLGVWVIWCAVPIGWIIADITGAAIVMTKKHGR